MLVPFTMPGRAVLLREVAHNDHDTRQRAVSAESGDVRRPHALIVLLGFLLIAGCADPDVQMQRADAAPSSEEPFRGEEVERPEAASRSSSDESSTPTGARQAGSLRRIGDRLVQAQRFDTLWHRGGFVDDTLLLNPVTLVADDSLVYVYDFGATRVAAFDSRTGEARWAFGRPGGGPGEFGGVLIVTPGVSEGVRILDKGNGRVMDVAADGQLIREWSVLQNAVLTDMCALSDGTTLAVSIAREASGVLRLGAEDHSIRRIPLPWGDLDNFGGVAKQGFLAQVGNGKECVFAFTMGRGFARIGPDGTAYSARHVEHFDLPATERSSSADGATRTSLPSGATYAVSSLSVDRDTVVVFFNGPRGPYQRRFLDHYEARTGRYLHSHLLDAAVRRGVRVNGTYFVIDIEGDFPSLTALRPQPR